MKSLFGIKVLAFILIVLIQSLNVSHSFSQDALINKFWAHYFSNNEKLDSIGQHLYTQVKGNEKDSLVFLYYWAKLNFENPVPKNELTKLSKKSRKAFIVLQILELQNDYTSKDFESARSRTKTLLEQVKLLDESYWRVTSECYKNLGLVDFYSENHASAITKLKKALKIKELHEIGLEEAEDYNILGFVFNGADQPDSTEHYTQLTLDVLSEYVDSTSQKFLVTYTNYAYGLLRKCDYNKASTHYNRILNLLERSEESLPYQQLFCLLDIGSIHAAQLNYDLAESYILNGIQQFKNEVSEFDREIFTAYLSLVDLYLEKNEPDKALIYCDSALGIIEEIYGEEHGSSMGYALNAKAKTLNYLHRYSESMEITKEVEKLWSNEFNNDITANWADLQLLKAKSEFGLGNFSNSLQIVTNAITVFRQFLNDNNPDFVNARLIGIDCHIKLGDSLKSRLLLEAFQFDYLINDQLKYPNLQLQYSEFLKLKLVSKQLFDTPKLPEYEAFLAEVDHSYYRSLASIGNKKSKLHITQSYKLIYEEALPYCFSQFQNSSNNKWLQLGLHCIESSKNLHFREQLVKTNIDSFSNVPLALLEQIQNIETQFNYLEVKLQSSDNNQQVELFNTYQNLIVKHEQLLQFIKEKHPRYHELQYEAPKADFAKIIGELNASKTNLLIYHLVGDSIYQIYLRGHSVEIHVIPYDSTKLLAQQYLTALKDFESIDYKSESRALYDLLIPSDPTSKDLIIIRDVVLSTIPFDALLDSNNQFLIEKHKIIYLNSLFEISQNQETVKAKILSIVPGFEEELLQQIDNDEYGKLLRQPNAIKQSKRLSKKYKGDFLLGPEATDQAFINKASQFELLHLASHFELNQNPLQSRLYLAPDNQIKSDGVLTLGEFMGIPLKAQLTILLACDSGQGTYQAGEGLISLARTLRFAGCNSTIMSLWKIDEPASVAIIDQFYKNLSKNESVAQSLRKSKLSFLNHEDSHYHHPYYWSGISLLGIDHSITIQRNGKTTYLSILLIISILVIVLTWSYKK